MTDHWRRQGEPELQEELLEAVEPEEGGDGAEGDFDPDQDDLLARRHRDRRADGDRLDLDACSAACAWATPARAA